jgi:hypothetical protein
MRRASRQGTNVTSASSTLASYIPSRNSPYTTHYDPAASSRRSRRPCASRPTATGVLIRVPDRPVLIFASRPALVVLGDKSMFKVQTPALGIYITTTEERHQSSCPGELYDVVEHWRTAMVASSSTDYIILVMKRVRWRLSGVGSRSLAARMNLSLPLSLFASMETPSAAAPLAMPKASEYWLSVRPIHEPLSPHLSSRPKDECNASPHKGGEQSAEGEATMETMKRGLIGRHGGQSRSAICTE